jgi:hypothetical protein
MSDLDVTSMLALQVYTGQYHVLIRLVILVWWIVVAFMALAATRAVLRWFLGVSALAGRVARLEVEMARLRSGEEPAPAGPAPESEPDGPPQASPAGSPSPAV